MSNLSECEKDFEKYFAKGRITEVVGENASLKESFVMIYICKKAIETNTNIILLTTKPISSECLMYRLFMENIKETQNKNKNKNINELKSIMENRLKHFEFLNFESIGSFILNGLQKILDKDKNISFIIINNLNFFFESKTFNNTQDNRKYLNHLRYLALNYQINITYLNDFFYYCENKFLFENLKKAESLNKQKQDELNNDNNNMNSNNNNIDLKKIEKIFTRQPALQDNVEEFCSHILFAENRKLLMNENYENNSLDNYERGVFQVAKSNHKSGKKFMISIDRFTLKYYIDYE